MDKRRRHRKFCQRCQSQALYIRRPPPLFRPREDPARLPALSGPPPRPGGHPSPSDRDPLRGGRAAGARSCRGHPQPARARYLPGELGGRAARPAPAGDRVFHPAREPLGRDRAGAGRQTGGPGRHDRFRRGGGDPPVGAPARELPGNRLRRPGRGRGELPGAGRVPGARGRLGGDLAPGPGAAPRRPTGPHGRPAARARAGRTAHAGAARRPGSPGADPRLRFQLHLLRFARLLGPPGPLALGRLLRRADGVPARARPALRTRERRHLHPRPGTRDRGLQGHRRPRPGHRLGGDLARGRGGRGGARLDAPRGLYPDQLRGRERVGGDPPAVEQADPRGRRAPRLRADPALRHPGAGVFHLRVPGREPRDDPGDHRADARHPAARAPSSTSWTSSPAPPSTPT